MRHAVYAKNSSSEQMLGEMTICAEVVMAPEETALEHPEIDNVAGFLVEFERVDDGESSKRQDFELECENGMGVMRSPWMDMEQWWRLWHRNMARKGFNRWRERGADGYWHGKSFQSGTVCLTVEIVWRKFSLVQYRLVRSVNLKLVVIEFFMTVFP